MKTKTLIINKENVNKLTNNFTLGNLTTRRACINGIGWDDIKIDESFFNESIDNIANLLGGRQKTKETIKFKLRNEPIYEWFGSRIVFNNNKWEYVSGQNYSGELTQIRKILTN